MDERPVATLPFFVTYACINEEGRTLVEVSPIERGSLGPGQQRSLLSDAPLAPEMEPIFTAAGCNAEIGVLDVSPFRDTLAYASGCTVLTANIGSSGGQTGRPPVLILPPLNDAADATNTVHIVRVAPLSGAIVAGTADGHINCWWSNGGAVAAGPVSYSHGQAINTLCLWEDQDSRQNVTLTIIFADIIGGLHQIHATLGGSTCPFFIHDASLSFGLCKIISVAAVRLPQTGDLLLLLGATDNALSVLLNMQRVLSLPGHSNWINSVDCRLSEGNSNNCVRIITGSSDRVIRVWQLAPAKANGDTVGEGTEDTLQELVPNKRSILIGTTEYGMECESILYGHEGAIHSVRWEHFSSPSSPLCFWSAAADHTIIRWQESSDRSGWVSTLQIGDISSLGTVGGDRSFGFYSAIPVRRSLGREPGDEPHDGGDDYRVIAHGSTGSIIQYELVGEGLGGPTQGGLSVKRNSVLVSGHTSDIVSCSWEPHRGQFLATASKDMTSRLWSLQTPSLRGELARPQIHGYEMKAIVVLDAEHLISAADEKILRSFVAPPAFLYRLGQHSEDDESAEQEREEAGAGTEKSLAPASDSNPNPHSALSSSKPLRTCVFVPALGLSNREGTVEAAFEAGPGEAPTEYDLSRLSLWRETDKLYGHGLELQALAVTRDGRLAASASRATSPEDAQIRFWQRCPDKENGWKALPACTLKAHALTVVSLAFSPNDRYLLAVSRDRHFSLSSLTRGTDGGEEWGVHLMTLQEAHTRIIWCAAWGASSTFFVTGSRDCRLRTWQVQDGEVSPVRLISELEFPTALTAVAIKDDRWLVVGTEEGRLYMLMRPEDGSWKWCQQRCLRVGPTAPVTDLKWHPRGEGGEAMLAVTCSNLLLVLKVSLY